MLLKQNFHTKVLVYTAFLENLVGNETIIYIGKTESRFRDRLKNHKKSWLSNYRGEKIVRFGTIIKPITVTKDIINDAESAIIFEIEPKHNTDKKREYNFTELYKIENKNYKGKLPKYIDINSHL